MRLPPRECQDSDMAVCSLSRSTARRNLTTETIHKKKEKPAFSPLMLTWSLQFASDAAETAESALALNCIGARSAGSVQSRHPSFVVVVIVCPSRRLWKHTIQETRQNA